MTSLTRPPRLLVVDDDPGVLSAYRLVLERSDDPRKVQNLFRLDRLEAELFGQEQPVEAEWRLTFVDQGDDAVSAVKWAIEDGDPFAAIFMDVRMPPGLDGWEAAAEIRKIDPNVHIIVVTGYSDYAFEDFVEVAGPESKLTYLPKPVWPDELRKVARRFMPVKPPGSSVKVGSWSYTLFKVNSPPLDVMGDPHIGFHVAAHARSDVDIQGSQCT